MVSNYTLSMEFDNDYVNSPRAEAPLDGGHPKHSDYETTSKGKLMYWMIVPVTHSGSSSIHFHTNTQQSIMSCTMVLPTLAPMKYRRLTRSDGRMALMNSTDGLDNVKPKTKTAIIALRRQKRKLTGLYAVTPFLPLSDVGFPFILDSTFGISPEKTWEPLDTINE
ncbi:hypothetical protein PROFUN_11234 [Planoprotostelium fungivorum]|uniref:Uncharacterized protein n=1 Tax=Planoprotostelium fungivorum TaxID=1890364 RepID=A0A2P6NA56_9EUKA|nr:hypothetical protein PROFUN_11234 [Planoprotostelium fungivorum]